jgi:hypothetical protein
MSRGAEFAPEQCTGSASLHATPQAVLTLRVRREGHGVDDARQKFVGALHDGRVEQGVFGKDGCA